MPPTIMIDQWIVTAQIPANMTLHDVEVIRLILTSDEFINRINNAVHVVVIAEPNLAKVRFTIQR